MAFTGQMLEAGFVAEVERLRERPGLTPGHPSMRAVGYRQLWQHLAGEYPLDEAVAKAISATRQLAKRQLTWLRKWPELRWIYTDSAGNIAENGVSYSPGRGCPQTPLEVVLNYLD